MIARSPGAGPTAAGRALRTQLLVLLCILAVPAGAADGVSQTGLQAIEATYHQLILALQADRRNARSRQQIARSAQDFRDELQRDGGARPALESDATNIIKSLSDGSFSAEGSLEVLRRDVKGNVIDFGPWRPGSDGAVIPGPIGIHLDQSHEGDCVGVSVLKAFSTTSLGDALMHRVVTLNADGRYHVSMPGDPFTVYLLGSGDLDQYGKGEPAAAAVIGAVYRYFHLDPKHSALPTNKMMELLAGRLGDHSRLADAHSSPAQITSFLLNHARRVGVDEAMVFGGKPGAKGEWSKGDGHAFAVLHIDAATRTLTYTNPWDEDRLTRSLDIATLASQAASTSADFEVVAFRKGSL